MNLEPIQDFRFPSAGKCLVLLSPVVGFSFGCRSLRVTRHPSHLGFCPLTFSRFDESKAIPVAYGLPTEHGLEEAKQSHILLGGCMLGSIVAVCPHCYVSVKFRDWDAEYKGLHLP
jgi:hypothetical protein